MRLGIVGLPNVGKSTLFNSLTNKGVESENYPFCTIDPNIGVVSVKDHRLDVLTDIYNSEKTVPAFIEFVDIAGLVRGASKGEGRGNQFLSHIREVDAIVHVVRCFEDINITHVDDSVDPIRDIETINLELILSDLEIVERRLSKINKLIKNDKSYMQEFEILSKLKEALENGNMAKSVELNEADTALVSSFNLLTFKKVLYAANVNEEDLRDDAANNKYVKKVREFSQQEDSLVFVICAKAEEDIGELEEEDRNLFLDELGIKESGLVKLIASSYKLLGLISYLTAGPKETRAWTIENGTKAPKAAGKIHTDFEKGFIKAEIVSYDDLANYRNYATCKEKGLVRLEGKDYVVKDGDVILFRFNV